VSAIFGGKKVRGQLARVAEKIKAAQADGVVKNGEDVVRVAKLAVPVETGDSKTDIAGRRVDQGYMVDFGPKSKVIEGDNAPRPFANPSLKATRKRRKNRSRRLVNKAIKEGLGG